MCALVHLRQFSANADYETAANRNVRSEYGKYFMQIKKKNHNGNNRYVATLAMYKHKI